jgi:NitT/TauT family transport system permease protein
MKRWTIALGNALAVFGALLLLWQTIIWIFGVASYLLPTPWAVAKTLVQRREVLLNALAITAGEAGAGLAVSVAAGTVVALIFAQSRWLRRMLFPYTLLLQTVPIIAIAPLVILWVGQGVPAVILIAFIISLAPIIANATQGLISVDEQLVQLFVMYGASPMQLLFKLRLPNALPALFVGVRISGGLAVIGAIIGELYAGSSRVGAGGLGYSIQYASTQLQTAYLFALVAATTALGFAFIFMVMFLEWYFLHRWHESARAPETN